jgi:hypothetical protein
VYLIPRLVTNIVSIWQLNEISYNIDIDTDVIKVQEPRGLLLVRVNYEVNHLYLLHIKVAQSVCFMVCEWGDEEAWYWHERFRHINMTALRKLAWEELVRGLLKIGQVEQLCEVCQIEKQRHTSFQ